MFEGLERINYQSGDQIFQEGDEGDCAYLIENGSVELSILQKKEIFKIGMLEKNDLFGEMALIDKRPRMATATVLEETQVIRIPRNLIEEKLINVDPIIGHLLRLVLKRFRKSHYSLMGDDQFASDKVGEELDEDFSKTQENLILHVSIASDIQDGLRRDEFQLNYQPIISIIDNRVCPKATPSTANKPASSGPRCLRLSRIFRTALSRSATGRSGAIIPAIPHIVMF